MSATVTGMLLLKEEVRRMASALRHENERLREENARLREENERLRRSHGPDRELDGR